MQKGKTGSRVQFSFPADTQCSHSDVKHSATARGQCLRRTSQEWISWNSVPGANVSILLFFSYFHYTCTVTSRWRLMKDDAHWSTRTTIELCHPCSCLLQKTFFCKYVMITFEIIWNLLQISKNSLPTPVALTETTHQTRLNDPWHASKSHL